jgi:mono/diheme cytochrome c family protein
MGSTTRKLLEPVRHERIANRSPPLGGHDFRLDIPRGRGYQKQAMAPLFAPMTCAVGIIIVGVVLGLADAELRAAGPVTEPSVPEGLSYGTQVQPLLARYCYECHGDGRRKGGLALDKYASEAERLADRNTWQTVAHYVRNHEMPPGNKPQPTNPERDLILSWIEADVFECDCEHPDPGRVTIRRLNRVEYNNTLRDLLGIDFKPAEDFPADDVGYGFDNIGDVLSLPPLLLEKYLRAAEQAVAKAIEGELNLTDFGNRVVPRWFSSSPAAGEEEVALIRTLQEFGRRAYRRPLDSSEKDRLERLGRETLAEGESYTNALKLGMTAVLASPSFLFRGEFQADPDNPQRVVRVDPHALASRLSYFLWSAPPDDALLTEADQGTLAGNVGSVVRRMLKDPKAGALTENFAGQWLQLRKLADMNPDPGVFGDFDEALREAMRRETELLFETLLREDRSILELLDAEFTFVNERLARHYGLAGVQGEAFRRVSLQPYPQRRGILTHASILTLTANPTRTSPVKRGKWVLENILGAPPPPPPPNVPDLEESAEARELASLRQRMEQHRLDPLCASCHARMDPIGFAFEHYDGIGAWREKDGPFPIDASGQLATGERFQDAAGFRQILLRHRREAVLRCFAEKLLTYALGRGLEYYDKCAVDQIVGDAREAGYRFTSWIEAVARSVPFQMRRGDGSRMASIRSQH